MNLVDTHQKVDNIDQYMTGGALITDPSDVEAIRKLSNYNLEHPQGNFYLEFGEVELRGRTSEKNGGAFRVMTPQLRSKRLSKRRSSTNKEDNELKSKGKERRPYSSSGCSFYRRIKLYGLST